MFELLLGAVEDEVASVPEGSILAMTLAVALACFGVYAVRRDLALSALVAVVLLLGLSLVSDTVGAAAESAWRWATSPLGDSRAWAGWLFAPTYLTLAYLWILFALVRGGRSAREALRPRREGISPVDVLTFAWLAFPAMKWASDAGLRLFPAVVAFIGWFFFSVGRDLRGGRVTDPVPGVSAIRFWLWPLDALGWSLVASIRFGRSSIDAIARGAIGSN